MKPLSISTPLMLFLAVLLCGCDGKKVADQPKEKPQPIIGKKTQDIAEYDPSAGLEVSDGTYQSSLIKAATGNTGAYGTAVENIEVPRVHQLLEMYRATTGEYPKTHQDFMDEVIKKNNHKLTMLPHGKSYQYDVQNHTLRVVKDKQE